MKSLKVLTFILIASMAYTTASEVIDNRKFISTIKNSLRDTIPVYEQNGYGGFRRNGEYFTSCNSVDTFITLGHFDVSLTIVVKGVGKRIAYLKADSAWVINDTAAFIEWFQNEMVQKYCPMHKFPTKQVP